MDCTGATRRPRLSRWVLSCCLVILPLSGSGCLRILHPVRPPEDCPPPLLPRCCRDHVHIVFVHGLDPLDYANLSGLREYCHQLGFHNTSYGQLYHAHHLAEQVRRVRRDDPDSRFVLVGFSAGANVVNLMAHSLHQKNGIEIDLVVYIGGNTLKDVPKSRPESVAKVIHILATGYIWRGTQIEGAENLKYLDAWHFDSPTYPETLRVFARELAHVACQVPWIEVTPPVEELPPPSPTPRPLPQESAEPSTARDEWDFLKPVTALTPVQSRWPLSTPAAAVPSQQTEPPARHVVRP